MARRLVVFGTLVGDHRKLVTELAAVDYELGVLKTGREADVFLVRRGVPGTDQSCLLAAKRYRDASHRQFHRDAGYLTWFAKAGHPGADPGGLGRLLVTEARLELPA